MILKRIFLNEFKLMNFKYLQEYFQKFVYLKVIFIFLVELNIMNKILMLIFLKLQLQKQREKEKEKKKIRKGKKEISKK